VGTVQSLWQANMDLISDPPAFYLYDPIWKIYSKNPNLPPHFVGGDARVSHSLVPEGCTIYGEVEKSVLSSGLYIGRGAVVKESVVMPFARIEDGARVERAIIAEQAVVGKGCSIGTKPDTSDGDGGGITLVAHDVFVPEGALFERGSVIDAHFPEKKEETV